MRDATNVDDAELIFNDISIHASHAGCDRELNACCPAPVNFNPRIPCGMRPDIFRDITGIELFQSTHPMRDATRYIFSPMRISLFQSTHPMRDATTNDSGFEIGINISIHASHAGCDDIAVRLSPFVPISIHASHAGCDSRLRQASQL